MVKSVLFLCRDRKFYIVFLCKQHSWCSCVLHVGFLMCGWRVQSEVVGDWCDMWIDEGQL